MGRYEYGCSAERDGGACKNTTRVKRRELEDALLHEELFKLLESPEEVAKAAKELQAAFRAHVESQQRAATERPKELEELDARITRLRARLKKGDPDMAPDEIEAAIARAEAKRAELEARQPSAKASARQLAMLPRAAEEFRKQLALGLEGDERAVLRARVALRRYYGGEVRVVAKPNGRIEARWMGPERESAVFIGCPTVGSGGRI